MRRLTDIQALQQRCTKAEARASAVEAKNEMQATARADAGVKMSALETAISDLQVLYDAYEPPVVEPPPPVVITEGVHMALADAFKSLVLDHVNGTTSLDFDATVWLALGTDVTPSETTFTELSGNGYARQPVTWTASSGGLTLSNVAVVFGPAATNPWTAIRSAAIFTDVVGGTRVAQGALRDQSKTLPVGQTLAFPVNAISVQWAPEVVVPPVVTFPPVNGVNAMSYCHGDGINDDTQHILAAVTANPGRPIYFYNGTYLLSNILTLPEGTVFVGQSSSGTRLNGRVVFTSGCTFTDITIDSLLSISGRYVSTTGNDANPGTAASPFRTVAKGISVLAAGDYLYLRGGTYLQTAAIGISQSGTSSSPITISGYPGETAIISGDLTGNGINEATDTPGSQWAPLVGISGNYVTLKNVGVCFSGGRGIQINGSYNTVYGCNVHHTWEAGIYLSGYYNTVQANTVWRCTEYNYGKGGVGNWSSGICWGAAAATTPPGSGAYSQILDNVVYNNSGEGILGIHGDYCTIRGNTCYDNWAIAGIYPDNCSYTTVENNLVYWTGDTFWARHSNGVTGILFANEGIGTYPIGHDNKCINNIVVRCQVNISFWVGMQAGAALINHTFAGNTLVEAQSTGISLEAGSGAAHSNTRIADNLILQTGGTAGSVGTPIGLTFDHNIWSKAPGSGCSGTGDIISNPLLSDPSHVVTPGGVSPTWYKLTASSPARGTGVALSALATDFFGTARSAPPDMGAHEY